MSDELKNGDRVRLRVDESVTGTVVGSDGHLVIVDPTPSSRAHCFPVDAATWERIPCDEVTITIPREVRDWWAEKASWANANGQAIVEACRASKAAES